MVKTSSLVSRQKGEVAGLMCGRSGVDAFYWDNLVASINVRLTMGEETRQKHQDGNYRLRGVKHLNWKRDGWFGRTRGKLAGGETDTRLSVYHIYPSSAAERAGTS